MKRKKGMTSGQIDWVITLVPLILILTLASLFFAFPKQSNQVVGLRHCHFCIDQSGI